MMNEHNINITVDSQERKDAVQKGKGGEHERETGRGGMRGEERGCTVLKFLKKSHG